MQLVDSFVFACIIKWITLYRNSILCAHHAKLLFQKATPSYDLYASDGTKIGWIEKKLVSLMDSFDVYMEGKGGFGVTGLFKPTPAYRIEGDFLDRNFSFKNEEGKIVARVNMDGESV